jgi:hypothetical protein
MSEAIQNALIEVLPRNRHFHTPAFHEAAPVEFRDALEGEMLILRSAHVEKRSSGEPHA